MLNRQAFQRGMSLIELLIGIAILAVLLAIGGTSFVSWIQNSQIRTAAESIQNGLQVARAEAVKQNKQVLFQLMTSVDGACALSTTDSNWVVSERDAQGACANTPSDSAAAPDPNIIQRRSQAEGSRNVFLGASQAAVAFNSLGRVTNAAAGNITIDVQNPTGGDCVAAGGNMRCLRVIATPGGQIRMCDPAVTVATDSRVCP